MSKQWGVILLFTLGAWFVALALGAALMDTFPGDVAIIRAVQGVRLWGVRGLLEAVSVLGESRAVVASFAVAVVGLWLLRRRSEGLLVLAAAVPDLLNRGIKVAVGRPRPLDDVVRVLADSSGFAFPSGHVVHAMVFFGVVCYVTWRVVPEGAGRAALLVLWGAIILLTGLSRLYLGAHWPSDVLGGYVFGAFGLGLLVAGHRWYLDRRG